MERTQAQNGARPGLPAGPTNDVVRLVDLLRQDYTAYYRLALLLTGSPHEAEDVVQDVAVAVLARPRAVQEGQAVHAYVRACVVNRVKSRRRRLGIERLHRRRQEAADHLADDHSGAVALQQTLGGVLQELPHRQRTVLVLRYYVGASDTEIASIMSVS